MSDWQQINTGSVNDLVPNRWQAITWTNDGPVYCQHMCITKTQRVNSRGEVLFLYELKLQLNFWQINS